jgi:hypothetical protein
MPIGVVIDTNIFVHATNEEIYCNAYCINLLTHLIESDEDYINVDVDFDFTDESQNRSPLGEEYWEHIPAGSIGETMILQAIQDERIEFLPRKPHYHIVKKIGLYRKPTMKKSDRHFVGIAYQTLDRILISEDFDDFPQKRRNEIEHDLEVRIIQAYQIFQPPPE